MKAECRKQKAESKRQKAESKKQKALSIRLKLLTSKATNKRDFYFANSFFIGLIILEDKVLLKAKR